MLKVKWKSRSGYARVFPSLPSGKDHSLLVRNGYPVKAFRCSSAGDRPHIWKAFRVEENGLGESIDMTGFISEDAAVSFLVNTSTNTGYYLCVNTFNEDEIYDKFVVLTDGECRIRRMHVKIFQFY